MGYWKPGTIEEEPNVELQRWKVYEVSSELWPEPTRHFVGYNMIFHEGRVSSSIQEFDKTTMIGVTRSGRKYIIKEGTHGYDPDGNYVWGLWCYRNKINNIKDVTNEYTD